jgi:flagellar basal body-associated protein FliL
VKNNTIKIVIIIIAAVLLLGVIASLSSINSNVVDIKSEMKTDDGGNSNASLMNTTQNTTNNTNKTRTGPISIPLEKPPFID